MGRTLLNPLDAMWLYMESPETPMHLGVLAVFTPPRSAGTGYVQRLAAALLSERQAVPPWNLRLAGGWLSGALPRFEIAAGMDLDYHFRRTALPSPGGERELGVVLSRLHSNALDHNRPLWELHLVEGLQGGRFAFYLKIHHALVEDITAVPALLATLSAGARGRTAPPWQQPLAGGPTAPVRPRDLSVPTALRSAVKALSRLWHGGLARGTERTVLLPDSAPRSTLNRRIGAQRRIATWQLDEERVTRLAQATDSSVNTILAFLCGSSLRRFFKEYNALPRESLVGLIPVALPGQREDGTGNAIAALRAELGTHVGNPVRRLEAVKRSIANVRHDRETLPAEAAMTYSLLRSAPILASQAPLLGRWMPPLYNLHVSHTPGPDRPRYFRGARLRAIYPLTPLMQYSALSIDCVSYAGTLNVGFCGARDTLPHLQRLAVYLGWALDELEALVGAGGMRQ